MSLWLALFFLALGMSLESGTYSSVGVGGMRLLAIGGVLACWAFRKCPPMHRSWGLVMLIPAAALAMALPSTRLSVGWIAGAALIALLPLPPLRRMTAGLFWTGVFLLVMQAATRAFLSWSPLAKDLAFLAQPIASLLRALGAEANASGGHLFLRNADRFIDHQISIDTVAPLAAVLLLAGATASAVLVGAWRSISRLVLLFAIYALSRSIVLLLAMLESGRRELGWDPDWIFISLLGLPLVWGLVPSSRIVTRLGEIVAVPPFSERPIRAMRPIALAAAAVCALVLAATWPDPGARKGGRVLVDEGHSDWEWTTQRMDTEWYGEKSTYNYYSLRKYLELFYRVADTTEPITDSLLARCDVFVVKTPTRAYSSDEIDAIVRFVEKGGGVWLIGDHTNVFGITTHLNPIAQRFDFAFQYDATYDLQSGGLTLYMPPSRFRHPVVQNLPPYLFATSCSILPSWRTQRAIVGTNISTIPLDYSQPGFFAPIGRSHWLNTFGAFAQCVATTRGKGRVVGFSDSTCFSNFFMHVPGKPELVLGTVEWLNRRNRFGFLRILFAVAACGLGVVAWRSSKLPAGLAVWTVGGLLGVAAGAAIAQASSRFYYALPATSLPHTTVVFETEHSKFFLPIRQLLGGSDAEHFLTFYVWVQRLDWFPSVESNLEDAIARSPNVLVMIRPRKPLGVSEAADLHSYVEKGGSLLILDDLGLAGSQSNAILEPYGLSMDLPDAEAHEDSKRPARVVDSSGQMWIDIPESNPIRGGNPLLWTEGEKAAIVVGTRAGRGCVIACSAAYLFSSEIMGHTNATPTERQRNIYELEFAMLRAARERDVDRPLLLTPVEASAAQSATP